MEQERRARDTTSTQAVRNIRTVRHRTVASLSFADVVLVLPVVVLLYMHIIHGSWRHAPIIVSYDRGSMHTPVQDMYKMYSTPNTVA